MKNPMKSLCLIYSEIKKSKFCLSHEKIIIIGFDQLLIASCHLNYQEAFPYLYLIYQITNNN